MQKYGSKLYIPNKQLYKMSIKELCDHNKICRSLDNMSYNKIQKLENLTPEILEKKKKRFLERNNRKKTKKHFIRKRTGTRKHRNKNKLSRKNIRKKNKKKSMKSREIL